MSAFHFLRPFWLLALLPAVALWWALRRQSDTARRWRGAIDPALLRHFEVGTPARGGLRPGDALLAAWLVGGVAVAGPAWQREPSPFAAAAPPLMLVLRVTPSMQAADLPPNRLARATEKIADLLARNPDEPVGLIAYAGSAHLVLPPTRDPAVVRRMAEALTPAIMPKQGDALADAVALARKVLADGAEGGSVLILADQADPAQAARLRAIGAGPPVSILAMLPPGRAPDAGLRDAATALDADLATATVDTGDIDALARRALRSSASVTRPGETERWRDAGWFLVPLLVVVVLFWFRRGWLVLG